MSVGRKRSFSKQEALDKAMRLFWESGYAGTSLGDLTTGLGLHKPSLYAAFGNKEQLFELALEHYRTQYAMPNVAHLGIGSDHPLKDRLTAYLHGLVDLFTSDQTPLGCFFIKSSSERASSAFPLELTKRLIQMGAEDKQFLAGFLEEERLRGKLKEEANPDLLAEFLLTISYGLSMQAIAGKTDASLQDVVSAALLVFPFSR